MNKSRLHKKYEEEVVKKLTAEFNLKNIMQVPRVTKVVINMGVGSISKSKELWDRAKEDLAQITGQYPSERTARVSVSSFGVRKGTKVGLTVTLRGERMYNFLDKLFTIVIPRFRDFRGLSRKSFDNKGNYTLGIPEHSVFPEIDIAKSGVRGLEVSIVVKSSSKEESERLLELLGMPLEKVNN